jgi:hypothetical protein
MIIALECFKYFNKVIYFLSIISITQLKNIIMRMTARGETTGRSAEGASRNVNLSGKRTLV